MFKYLIKFNSSGATALFEYDEKGNLIKYELDPGNFNEAQFEYFIDKFPKRLAFIEKWIEWKLKNVVITKVDEDLSFDAFYIKYNQKLGKKQTAIKIWDQMSDVERAKAIKFIQLYDQELIKTGYGKKNAETYLNQKTWNN